MPSAARSFVYMNTFAGNTAISRPIMPQAAHEDTTGMHRAMPNANSARPLITFRSLGEGRAGGIMR